MECASVVCGRLTHHVVMVAQTTACLSCDCCMCICRVCCARQSQQKVMLFCTGAGSYTDMKHVTLLHLPFRTHTYIYIQILWVTLWLSSVGGTSGLCLALCLSLPCKEGSFVTFVHQDLSAPSFFMFGHPHARLLLISHVVSVVVQLRTYLHTYHSWAVCLSASGIAVCLEK